MAKSVLRIPAQDLQKYACPNVFSLHFSLEGIAALREKCHDVHGQPRFMDDFLHLKPESPNSQLLQKRPELIEWSDDGTMVLLPDYPYVEKDRFIASPASIKNSPEGLSLVLWYIHPKQLEQTVFSDPEKRNDFSKAIASICYSPSLEPKNNFARRFDQERIRDIEKKSGIPYLASVLDLKPEHLPWLENMKKMILKHLPGKYSIEKDDYVCMYFHTFIKETTATLHLHVGVNQGAHPLDASIRLSLDESIETLEKDKSIEDFLLAKQEHFRVGDISLLVGIPGVDIKEIKNPFMLQKGIVLPAYGKAFGEYIGLTR